MKKFLLTACAITTATLTVVASQAEVNRNTDNNSVVKAIDKHIVELAKKDYVPYKGLFNHEFPKGFPPGLGSGMSFRHRAANGDLYFYTVTDRGPNADAPKTFEGQKTKTFLAPRFTPFIGVIRLIPQKKAVLEKSIPLKVSGQNISGLPISPGMTGSTKEVPLSENFTVLPYDDNGMDTEGIALDRQGNVWISDEYGPFIAKVNPSTGQILDKYAPGEGLPEILKWRQPNRGMEGITIAPNGKIYGVIQSTLNVDRETRNQAQFIRIVEFDPSSTVKPSNMAPGKIFRLLAFAW